MITKLTFLTFLISSILYSSLVLTDDQPIYPMYEGGHLNMNHMPNELPRFFALISMPI